jgi:hypothetical protein
MFQRTPHIAAVNIVITNAKANVPCRVNTTPSIHDRAIPPRDAMAWIRLVTAPAACEKRSVAIAIAVG